jgi:hypothetical protein
MKSAMVSALVTGMAAIDVIAAAASASAEPVGTLTVQVVKYPPPCWGPVGRTRQRDASQ